MIFLLPRGLVRHFRSIVRIDVIDVCDGRHDRAMSGAIASEFVGDQPSRFTALAFEKTAEEAYRGFLVASPLDQNINRVAVLINRTPKIVLVTLNRDKHLIKIPGIT
jgi:hypothetical protein